MWVVNEERRASRKGAKAEGGEGRKLCEESFSRTGLLTVDDDFLQAYLGELTELPEFVELGPVGPRTRGNFGNTPLHVAAVRGEVDAIEALLDAGAEINAAGEHGYTALHEAVEQGQGEVVRLLLARGASVSAHNAEGQRALDIAEWLDNPQTAAMLRGREG